MTSSRNMTFSGAGDGETPKAPRSLRIILLDDDRDAVVAFMMVLRHEGHEVRGLYSAANLLREITDFNPDVVMMDIAMSGISGYEAARKIRERHGANKPLLISVSGVDKQGSERFLSSIDGFDHHLVKPYEASDVLRLIAPLKSR
jgi:two-component system CheB/CheR fusion protein